MIAVTAFVVLVGVGLASGRGLVVAGLWFAVAGVATGHAARLTLGLLLLVLAEEAARRAVAWRHGASRREAVFAEGRSTVATP